MSTRPKIKYVKTERVDNNLQQDLKNNENEKLSKSYFKPNYVAVDEENVVKEIKNSIIWAPASVLIII